MLRLYRLSSFYTILLVLWPSNPEFVSSYGWQINSLSDRLLGFRPRWIHPHRSWEERNGCYRGQSTGPLPAASNSQQPRRSTKRDQASILEFLQEPPNFLDLADLNPNSPLESDTTRLLNCIVQAADGRKAEDILALKVHHLTTLTSVLVILSGNSRPQNQAIARAIEQQVELLYPGLKPGNGNSEGTPESGWMLLDYGTVMVHIMTPKSRLFYNVQGLWIDKGAHKIDLTPLLIPNSPRMDSSTLQNDSNIFSPTTTTTTSQPEDDPFWS